MKKEDILNIIESTAISIASSFPVLSSLATGWNEYKNHVQSRNVEYILNKFFEDLKRIEDKIDQAYIETDNYKSIIVKTCFAGKEEISEEKKNYLAHFLANSATKENSGDSIKNSILETVLKLTPFDLNILDLIADKTKSNWHNSHFVYNPDRYNADQITEGDIINAFRNIRMLDIMTTLDYLVVNGVIENISSKINNFRDSQIKEVVLKHQIEDLENEQSELRINRKLTPEKDEFFNSSIKKLRQKLNLFPTTNYNQQKFYSITALGLKVISYIKTP